MLFRLDEQVRRQHRAVHDPGLVREPERDEQPPPDPCHVARVEPRGEPARDEREVAEAV